jgi:CPA1 family monovalent cation:H+ antiporter
MKLQQIKSKQEGYNEAAAKQMEIELRMKALKAENDYIAQMIVEKSIDKETAYRIQAHIRKIEAAVSTRFRYRILMVSALIIRIFFKFSHIFVKNKEEFRRKEKEQRKKIEKVRKELSEKAIQAVKSSITTENKEISYLIIGEYSRMISGIKSRKSEEYSRAFVRQERELKEKAFQAERDEIQKLYENGTITKNITQKIRQQINIRESYFMEAEGLDF